MNEDFPNYDRDADPHVLALLGALGKSIAFRASPKNASPSDSLVGIVRSTADSLIALDVKLSELSDPNAPPLDVMRVRDEVSALFASVQIRAAGARAAVDTARTALNNDEAHFYGPSPAGDAVAVALDAERRAAFSAADPTERDVLWQAMAGGEQGPLLTALARFDFGATAGRAKVLFKALASEGDPGRVRGFADEDEKLSWADNVLSQIDGALDAGSMVLGPRRAIADDSEPIYRQALH